jgi:hypothetical protein
MGICMTKWSGEGNTEKEAIDDMLKTMRRVCYDVNFYYDGKIPRVNFRYDGFRYKAVTIIIQKEEDNYYAYVY